MLLTLSVLEKLKNQEMSREVGCLHTLVSHFFIEKRFLSSFCASFKVNFTKSIVTREISPRGEIFNFNPCWKKMVSHLSFNTGQSKNVFASFHTELISYAVTGLYKNYDVRFHQQENKVFNFKTFKIVLLATINWKLVIASFLLNLYSCY